MKFFLNSKYSIPLALLIILSSLLILCAAIFIPSLHFQPFSIQTDSQKLNCNNFDDQKWLNLNNDLNIRLLEQSKKQGQLFGFNSSEAATYIVIIILVAFSVVLVCFLFIILYFYKKNILNSSTPSKQPKYNINFPTISSQKLQKLLKNKVNDKCAICLQHIHPNSTLDTNTYEHKANENETRAQKDGNSNGQDSSGIKIKIQINQFQFQCGNMDHIDLKITFCGHLLHAKCLDKWLQIQLSCPICRQVFGRKIIQKYRKILRMDNMGDFVSERGQVGWMNKDQINSDDKKGSLNRQRSQQWFLKILDYYKKSGKFTQINQKRLKQMQCESCNQPN